MTDEFCVGMSSPIGTLLLRSRNDFLVGIEIRPTIEAAEGSLTGKTVSGKVSDDVLEKAQTQLGEYFAGRRTEFSLPVDLSGVSPFTQKVLGELQRVGYGDVLTYGDLAERVGSPRGARAVGRVMASNPLPIVIPCHRVIARGGALGGYSGGAGLTTKQWLLDFEQGCRQRNRLNLSGNNCLTVGGGIC